MTRRTYLVIVGRVIGVCGAWAAGFGIVLLAPLRRDAWAVLPQFPALA